MEKIPWAKIVRNPPKSRNNGTGGKLLNRMFIPTLIVLIYTSGSCFKITMDGGGSWGNWCQFNYFLPTFKLSILHKFVCKFLWKVEHKLFTTQQKWNSEWKIKSESWIYRLTSERMHVRCCCHEFDSSAADINSLICCHSNTGLWLVV